MVRRKLLSAIKRNPRFYIILFCLRNAKSLDLYNLMQGYYEKIQIIQHC